MNRSLLVVGVGNVFRGDDGLGPLVVDALRAEPLPVDGVDTMVASGDLTDLVVTWTGDDDVVVVDAVDADGPPGAVIVIDALHEPLPDGGRALSSHGLGLAVTIELARLLDRLPRSLTVIGVQLDGAGPGDRPTAAVTAAVDEVVSMIIDLVPTAGVNR